MFSQWNHVIIFQARFPLRSSVQKNKSDVIFNTEKRLRRTLRPWRASILIGIDIENAWNELNEINGTVNQNASKIEKKEMCTELCWICELFYSVHNSDIAPF